MQENFINIGGLEKFSLVNWPGISAAVIFTQGCNWSCPFCYSGDLVPFNVPENADKYKWLDILNFLKSRVGKLDGVVFSGGEPLLQKNIKAAIEEIRNLKFKIGLHTNGSNPLILKEILHLIDWVGIDVKANPNNYKIATGGCGDFTKVLESLNILIRSQINFEARTTLDPRLINVEGLLNLAKMLSDLGVKNYAIQAYQPVLGDSPLEPNDEAIKQFFNEKVIKQIEKLFDNFMARK